MPKNHVTLSQKMLVKRFRLGTPIRQTYLRAVCTTKIFFNLLKTTWSIYLVGGIKWGIRSLKSVNGQHLSIWPTFVFFTIDNQIKEDC